jgi:hypothetical protein
MGGFGSWVIRTCRRPEQTMPKQCAKYVACRPIFVLSHPLRPVSAMRERALLTKASGALILVADLETSKDRVLAAEDL